VYALVESDGYYEKGGDPQEICPFEAGLTHNDESPFNDMFDDRVRALFNKKLPAPAAAPAAEKHDRKRAAATSDEPAGKRQAPTDGGRG
jgi:hypothetical protein